MLDIVPVKGTIAAHSASRCNCTRDRLLFSLVLYGVLKSAQALAGDQLLSTDSAQRQGAANFRTTQISSPATIMAPVFSSKPLSDVEVFSATEFRPRKRSFVEDPARGGRSVIDAPMLQSSSLWQQMAEYRSEDRVRLLTLWQTRGSSLSLQAGKRGSPSLQWSTPWVHREGGASRGLFDRLLTMPTRVAGSNARSNVPRPTTAALPSKPMDSGAGVSAK